MLAAMMGPMLALPVRHVLDRSFARRRLRAVMLLLAAYVAVWMVAGMLFLALGLAIPQNVLQSPVFVAAVVGVAFIWECSPFKQRCLNRGHAHTALAAFGVAAELDSLRFGLNHGIWCVGSCWALMLVPEMFPSSHLEVMALVTLWLLAIRLERPRLPGWRLRSPARAVRIVIARLARLRKPNPELCRTVAAR